MHVRMHNVSRDSRALQYVYRMAGHAGHTQKYSLKRELYVTIRALSCIARSRVSDSVHLFFTQ